MSSKSKATLPRVPLTSSRRAFLRPVADRVASKTPAAPEPKRARNNRRVVDRHPAASGARRAGRFAAPRGQGAFLDEGRQQPVDAGDVVAGDVLGEVDQM